MVTVDHFPVSIDLTLKSGDLVATQRRDAAAARHTMFVCQFAHWLLKDYR
jgi:hypothetical protein